MTTKPQTGPAGTPTTRREPGITPLVTHGRVRNPSGLVAHDAAGNVECDEHANPRPLQRGEIVSLEFYRAHLARLLLAQRTLLECSQADYDAAPVCPHGRHFASVELAGACRCRDAGKPTSL